MTWVMAIVDDEIEHLFSELNEQEIETWIKTRVSEIYDMHHADPGRGLPIEEVRQALKEQRLQLRHPPMT